MLWSHCASTPEELRSSLTLERIHERSSVPVVHLLNNNKKKESMLQGTDTIGHLHNQHFCNALCMECCKSKGFLMLFLWREGANPEAFSLLLKREETAGSLHLRPGVKQGMYSIVKMNFTSLIILFLSACVSIPLIYDNWIITLVICFITKTA